MKKFNRLLSVLLVVVMLAGLMTVAASAEDAAKVDVTYNGNGGTYTGSKFLGQSSVTVPKTVGATEKTSDKWELAEHKLVGWVLTGDNSGKVYAPDEEFVVAETDMIFTARWEKIDSQQPGEGTTPPAGGTEGGNQGGTEGGNQGGTEGGNQGGTEGGNQGGTEGGNQGGTEGGNQGGNQGGTEGGNQGGTEGGNQGGNEGGNQGGTEGGNQGGTEGGNQGGTEGGNQGGTTPPTGGEGTTPVTKYTVTFDSVGGSAVAPVDVESGKTVAKPADPTKAGYTFKGWKLGVHAYDFATPVTGAITLVAIWEQNSVSVSLSSIVDKKLVLKDNLPMKFNETFKAVVYVQSNPGGRGPGGRPGMMPGRPYPDGYVNYRNLEYVATLETSVAVMRRDNFFKYPAYFKIPDFRWKNTLTQDFVPAKGSDITELTFTQPGTYTYYVKEVPGKTMHMSYDTDWKKVVITVTEVEGVLKASVKAVTITNVYDKSANFNADANSTVTLTKVDASDKTKVLQGAQFKLYQEGKYSDYEYYNTYTTNYNGVIEIHNLAPGDYYFIEVTAPVGYELDDAKIAFTVGKTKNTKDVELTVTNKKINIFTEEHFAYIQGYEDGTVRPQNNITRAEAATILFRLLDDSVRSTYWDTASSYADVSSAAWYNNAVATLENMGVLEVGANYRPNDYITRAELAFMITNFYDMANLDIEGIALSDISGHVYETAIKQAAAMGWVKGYTDGSFNPDANITRAEAMTLINRVLGRAVEERGMCAGMKTFPDNPVTAWYYEDVQEATNSHTYKRSTTLVSGYDFYYETWGSIEANRDWSALEATWGK